jgi:hypothetical protein
MTKNEKPLTEAEEQAEIDKKEKTHIKSSFDKSGQKTYKEAKTILINQIKRRQCNC